MGFTLVANNATNNGMRTQTAFSTFRKTRGLTLESVAGMFGVDRKTILRWEQGSTPLPIRRLDEIESVTGISRHDLRPDVFGKHPEAAE
jgi:transcriptional regulator with XRE-family HTH domain